MVKAIPMEDWLRGCIYHDGRHGYVTLPTDKVHQIANYIQRTRRSGMDGLIDLEVVEADRKDEPTISKMEQVEDEPRLTAKCLNCNNAKACKEKHWDGCVYEPKDEKTCETCRHWKYIAHEWQCEACKCQGYEPKDEPQTDGNDYRL